MNTIDNEIVHSFSRDLAALYGVNGAILLNYIGYKIQRSKHLHDGKNWYYDTIDSLAQRYPYLGRTAIHQAIQRLTNNNGPLIKGNFNKRSGDRTVWYALRDARTALQLQTEPLYFKLADATAYGVAGAVLIGNLTYWLTEKRKKEPDYSAHPLSALKLAEHLPFSRSTIQRTLDHLVEAGVFVPTQPTDSRQPTLYSLGEAEVVEEVGVAGSNPDLVGKGEEPAQESIQDMAGSIPNHAGSNPDMGGSIPNIAGSKQDNYTILIDDCLKDACLKEVCLKENHFQTPSSGGFQNTHKPGAELSLAKNEGHNDFCEVIDPPIPGQSESGEVILSAALIPDKSVCAVAEPKPISQSNHCTDALPASDLNLAPNPVSLADAKPDRAFPVKPFQAPEPSLKPPKPEPAFDFVDPVVHKRCIEVFKFHNDDKPVYEGFGENLVGCIQNLISLTDPKDIYQLFKIKKQLELDGALKFWASDYFGKEYDTNFSSPDLPNQELREQFINHAICFLHFGFHSAKFEYLRIYCGPYSFQVEQAIHNRMSAWIEEQTRLDQEADIRARKVKYTSPDIAKESDASLTAAEKMRVFSQSLQARNRIGKYNEFNRFTEEVVVVQRNSLNYAREFFQLNPHFTVADLNRVLDECLKLSFLYIDDDEDPQWHARNGRKISLLLTSLATIAAQLNMLSELPPFTPIQAKEDPDLVKDGKKSDTTDKSDN